MPIGVIRACRPDHAWDLRDVSGPGLENSPSLGGLIFRITNVRMRRPEPGEGRNHKKAGRFLFFFFFSKMAVHGFWGEPRAGQVPLK